jgi:predicted nucleic acid-binding protein
MIVVDASAMIELLLGTAQGQRVAERVHMLDASLHAPHLLDLEVTQAFRRLTLQGRQSDERVQDALEDLLDLPMSRYPHTDYVPRVWALRSSLTAYDATYAALAEDLGALIVTTDERFLRAHGYDADIELIEA